MFWGFFRELENISGYIFLQICRKGVSVYFIFFSFYARLIEKSTKSFQKEVGHAHI